MSGNGKHEEQGRPDSLTELDEIIAEYIRADEAGEAPDRVGRDSMSRHEDEVRSPHGGRILLQHESRFRSQYSSVAVLFDEPADDQGEPASETSVLESRRRLAHDASPDQLHAGAVVRQSLELLDCEDFRAFEHCHA